MERSFFKLNSTVSARKFLSLSLYTIYISEELEIGGSTSRRDSVTDRELFCV